MEFYIIRQSQPETEKMQCRADQLMQQYELSRRDIKSLLDHTVFIQPHKHCLTANLGRFPLLITRNKVLIMRQKNAVSDTNDPLQFAQDFDALKAEANAPSWELQALEAGLIFVNRQMNSEYLRLVSMFDQYKYQNHGVIQQLAQQLENDCTQFNQMLADIVDDENILPFMTFANWDAIREARSLSNGSSRISSTASLSGLTKESQSKPQRFRDHFLVQDLDEIELPVNTELISDLFETYRLHFANLKAEVTELQARMNMKIVETQMKLEIQRTFIQNFQLKQKMINVSATFASIIGQMFGMNLLNPWRAPDGHHYNEDDTRPFTAALIVALAFFVVMLSSLWSYSTKFMGYGYRQMKTWPQKCKPRTRKGDYHRVE